MCRNGCGASRSTHRNREISYSGFPSSNSTVNLSVHNAHDLGDLPAYQCGSRLGRGIAIVVTLVNNTYVMPAKVTSTAAQWHPRQLFLHCSRLPFRTQFYLPHPWGSYFLHIWTHSGLQDIRSSM